MFSYGLFGLIFLNIGNSRRHFFPSTPLKFNHSPGKEWQNPVTLVFLNQQLLEQSTSTSVMELQLEVLSLDGTCWRLRGFHGPVPQAQSVSPFSSYQCDKKLRKRLPCHCAGTREDSLSAPTFPTENRGKAEVAYLHLVISRCNIEPEFIPNSSETQILNLHCWFPFCRFILVH